MWFSKCCDSFQNIVAVGSCNTRKVGVQQKKRKDSFQQQKKEGLFFSKERNRGRKGPSSPCVSRLTILPTGPKDDMPSELSYGLAQQRLAGPLELTTQVPQYVEIEPAPLGPA